MMKLILFCMKLDVLVNYMEGHWLHAHDDYFVALSGLPLVR